MKHLIYLVMILAIVSCSNDDSNSTASPAVPVATEATNISNSSFLANWNSASNATEYRLQVATETSFANPTTQTNLGGPTAVTQLNGNTEYFYRVSATNLNQNPSGYSNIINVITLPNAPIALAGSDITEASFQANWETVTGVTEYLLYVSQDNFTSSPPQYVSGYDGIIVNSNSQMVSGLDSNSNYYFRLESKVDSRISEPSNSELIQTL